MHVSRSTEGQVKVPSLLKRAWLTCGIAALALTLVGLFTFASANTAEAASVQSTTAHTVASALPTRPDIVVTSIRRISRTTIVITFSTRTRYDSFWLRYRDGNGRWNVVRLGRATRVVIILRQAPRHHFFFQVLGFHGRNSGVWSNPYGWTDR